MGIKKISIFIASILVCFVAYKSVFSSPLSIEESLDLNYGIELYELSFAEINTLNFSSRENQRRLEHLQNTNTILKNLISIKYKNGDFGYYQMNGIVKNYTDFIYHTNKYFEYIKLQEQKPYLGEIDYAISKNYRSMRESYKKLVQLID